MNKEYWNKYKRTIIITGVVLMLFTGFYLAGRLSTRPERITQNNNIVALNSAIQAYEVTIDGLKSSVHEKQAIILSQFNAIRAGVLERDRLKALHFKSVLTNTQLSGTIKILRDSLKLPNKPIYITIKDTSGVTHDYIRIPFDLIKLDETYLKLNTGMNANKTAWFNLSVPVAGEMTIGYKKDGLFKKPVAVGVLTTENPYLRIDNMNILIVEKKKSVFQKAWFNLVLGGMIVETANILLK